MVKAWVRDRTSGSSHNTAKDTTKARAGLDCKTPGEIGPNFSYCAQWGRGQYCVCDKFYAEGFIHLVCFHSNGSGLARHFYVRKSLIWDKAGPS